MGEDLSRRAFTTLLAAAGSTVITGFDTRTRRWVTNLLGQDTAFSQVPRLDGALRLDLEARKAIAIDSGNLFHRVPAAVLEAGSVRDIVAMVKYANTHSLNIAIKGHGHSRYGQTQAEGGLVIDSNSLRKLSRPTVTYIDAQPGATWGDIAQAAIPLGLGAPVFLTCMDLTVGGTLSAGGAGQLSHRLGTQLDHVLELDVVTGGGQLITCSPARERELFEMVLGGQGQCAIIVRARIPLVRAPSHAILHDVTYRDFATCLADQRIALADQRFDESSGAVDFTGDTASSYTLTLGKFYSGAQSPDVRGLEAGLRFGTAAEPRAMSYMDYLYRMDLAGAAARSNAASRATPHLMIMLPASRAADMMSMIVGSPRHVSGHRRYAFIPLTTTRCTRPLFKVPAEDHAVAFWLPRDAAGGDEHGLAEILGSYQELLTHMTELGGKRYAPYSTVTSPADWRAHFGPATWRRLAAAKRTFDPNHVLSPQPDLFGRGRT